ncbi:MAG: type II toxin-antitoxin system PemK/MazF family toxin [Nocardioides sp.]
MTHPIWLVRLDKTRPVLVLTREEIRAVRGLITVAPITSTVRGLSSEVIVGQSNGLEHESVVNLDSITTVPRDALLRPLGALLARQETDLTRAFHEAFDLAD